MPLNKDDLLSEARKNITVIDARQTEELMASGSIILDVREPAEFDSGHLPNAVHIPRGLIEFMVGNHPKLKDFEHSIVVYCKNGGRSTLAADTLIKMGFENIRMLAGGFDDWKGSIHKIDIADNQFKS